MACMGRTSRSRRPCARGEVLCTEPGKSHPCPDRQAGRVHEGNSRTMHMHADENSDGVIVPEKRPNKEGLPSAEAVEGRTPPKGNGGETGVARTLRPDTASNGLIAVRRAARQSKSVRFTALLHHITIDLLKQSYLSLERDSAPGIDGVTWQAYGKNLEEKLKELHDKVHRGSYRARPARRTYIPKADGSKRPLSILCLEDKIVQQAVATVLEAIYEEDFLGLSYGFRPGRGQHDALDPLHAGILRKQVNWVLDADIRGLFDTASYCPMVHEVWSKSSDCRVITLLRIPFFVPFVTCATSSSPRLTRCNTVWREMPSLRVASCMVTKPSPAVSLNRAMRSSVRRMRQGAPGVSCSPGMMPSLSQRCKVEGATPSTTAAFLIDASSPLVEDGPASKHGMSQWRRRLPTRPASKRWPYTVVRPWRLRMPAITVSG